MSSNQTGLSKPDTAIRDYSKDGFFTQEQWQLMTDMIMRGATPPEIAFFGEVCKRVGLDPFKKQIHAVKRWDSDQKRFIWSYQTGIDGYRSIANSCGDYAGSDEPVFVPPDESAPHPRKATVTVWKLVRGQRVPFTASARWEEYVQTTKEGKPNSMWRKMPYGQLAKCFDDKTEILTHRGFKKFADVKEGDLIAAVHADHLGIDFVPARPFAQPYTGWMATLESDALDFSVTPNHDMVTNLGKMEARAMLELASSKSNLTIPLRISEPAHGSDNRDEMLLLGYILADGTRTASGKWKIAVSKPRKIAALQALELHEARNVIHCKGKVSASSTREIRSNFDKECFTYSDPLDALTQQRTLTDDFIRTIEPNDARIILDAWQQFDGHTNRKTGLRRIYATDPGRAAQIETLAVLAGYSISPRRTRTSDISDKPNFYFSISSCAEVPVKKWKNNPGHPSIKASAYAGLVWCVTVPSGLIVVRRNGFSMICGNCAEALALRKAWPDRLSGVHTDVEMEQADSEGDPPSLPASANAAPRFDTTIRPFEKPAAPPQQQPAEPAALEAETVDPWPIPDDIAAHINGRWKTVIGDIKGAELTSARKEGSPAALASVIDQVRAILAAKNVTEETFAEECGQQLEGLAFPQDLWMDPDLYPSILNLAKAIA